MGVEDRLLKVDYLALSSSFYLLSLLSIFYHLPSNYTKYHLQSVFKCLYNGFVLKKIALSLGLALILLTFPKAALAAATLSFSPASKSVNTNDTFNVDVILNTGGSDTDGADVIVRYDGNKLSLVSASLGSLYANKLTADTSTSGKITFRATSTEITAFNGTGTFASMTFKAIASGTANVYFDFTAGSTTDSNVAYKGADILGSVANASYTIGTSTSGGTTTGGTTTGGTTSIPVSGTVEPTILLLGGGILLLLLGGIKLIFFSI